MVGGQVLTVASNFLGTIALGFSLSWAMTLVGGAPILLLIPVGYCAFARDQTGAFRAVASLTLPF